MNLIRYKTTLDDFAPTSFSNLVDRFFNETVSRAGGAVTSFVPRVDIIESEKAFEIHLAVPGMNKEDFKLDVKDNTLTVSGERKFDKEQKDRNYHVVESHFGSFTRSFELPELADAAKITARYVNGILEINIPRDEKKILKKTIAVD